MPRSLVLILGGKGGDGRTTVSRLLFESLSSVSPQRIRLRGYDMDARPHFAAIYAAGEITSVSISDPWQMGPILDALVDDSAGDAVSVVDTSGQSSSALRTWLVESGPALAARDQLIDIHLVYVLGPSARSISSLREILDMWGDVPYRLTVIKNHGFGETFTLWEQSDKTRNDAAHKARHIIDLPRLEASAYRVAEVASIPYGAFIEAAEIQGSPNSFSQRLTVRAWLDSGIRALAPLLADKEAALVTD